MDFVRSRFRNLHSFGLVTFLQHSMAALVLYLVVSLLVRPSKPAYAYSSRPRRGIVSYPPPTDHAQSPTYTRYDVQYSATSLQDIVFGISSTTNMWPKRKEYVRLWWRSQMRGCVYLEGPLDLQFDDDTSSSNLPPICVSGDTSKFSYTNLEGHRSAIRLARVVSETVRRSPSNVEWYVFGDDDTVFFPENLVMTLSKYDHQLWYYIGTNSEIYEQNKLFGFEMGFGGAGFALSAPLAKVLANNLDSCIQRYPHLYGSDSRIFHCLGELGIGLTHERGFHQIDLHGDIFGLLASHPVTPLVSLHHLDTIKPIFPNKKTNEEALEHLFEAVKVDPLRILQQTVCYNHRFSWTISVSWGYAVQIYGNHLVMQDVVSVPVTFQQWKGGGPLLAGVYTFNNREVQRDPCKRPAIFFLQNVFLGRSSIQTVYWKSPDNCPYDDTSSPRKVNEVRVFSHEMELDLMQLRAPRRHCCDVLPSSGGHLLDIEIRECGEEEFTFMHP